jgi:peptide/nickel transport system substrate-binding protein
MMGTTAIRHFATAAGLCVLVATALGTGAGPASAQEEKVLRVVPYADLRNTDPIWTTATITQNHAYMIYDTLFALDENFEPQPQMVGDWSASDDGLTYTFTLRDGLTFHDGQPVTSEDVIPSLQRWGVRDTMGQVLMNLVDRMEAVDDKTFEIVLKEPYALVIESLAKPTSNVPFIMPKRLAETDPYEQVTEFTGSGPYRFVEEEWVPGNKVVYEKFEDYVPRDEPASGLAGGKQVYVDRVEWFYIPDPQTAIAALQNDEVDFYESPPPDLLPMLQSDPNITIDVLDPLGRQVILRPNHLYPPFDKAEARQALAWTVDQAEYMTAMVGNPEYFRTCDSMLTCGTPNATNVDSEPLVKKDMAKAKELLEAAGYNGETVVVMHPTDHPTANAALVTAANLRELGIKVDLQAMDWATLTTRRTSKNPPEEGGWNIFHTRHDGYQASLPVAHLSVAAGGDEAWFGWPDNPKIEELRQAWAMERDPAKADEILKELHAELMRYQPYVPVGQYAMPSAWRSDVTGVLASPASLVLWNIDLE